MTNLFGRSKQILWEREGPSSHQKRMGQTDNKKLVGSNFLSNFVRGAHGVSKLNKFQGPQKFCLNIYLFLISCNNLWAPHT